MGGNDTGVQQTTMYETGSSQHNETCLVCIETGRDARKRKITSDI